MPGAFPFVILFKGAKCAFDLPGFSEVQNARLIFAPVRQKAFSAIVEFFRFWASFLICGHMAQGTKSQGIVCPARNIKGDFGAALRLYFPGNHPETLHKTTARPFRLLLLKRAVFL